MSEQQPEVKIKFVKKKGGHAAAHGGAWKIAYADLVTAMMAFFLLMWLLNSANANTKTGLAKYFSEGPDFFKTPEGMAILSAHSQGILPGGRGMKPVPDIGEGENLATEEASAEKERQAMENTAQAIEQAFSSDKLLQAFKDQISMDFTDEGLRIQVQDKAAQVLFDSGSAHLKAYTLSILKEIAQELGKLPNRVVIGGHTDSVQYPSQAYTNWELSAERANAARRVLEASGLKPGQTQRVTGYADSVRLEGKKPDDPQNRRISIVVLSNATVKLEEEHRKSKGDASKTREPKPVEAKIP
jgi:chemotaxis protein MotB